MDTAGKNLWPAFAGLLILIALGFGAYFYFGGGSASSPQGGSAGSQDPAAIQKRIEDAYRADTYGGATPQETLDLFVEALRAGDVELASKYFALDDNLSREKWVGGLTQAKKENQLDSIAEEIKNKAVPSPLAPLYEGDFQFVIYGEDEMVDVTIDMELNPWSKVWKIESL